MKKAYHLLLVILLVIGAMTGIVKASSVEITSTDYVVSKENATISRILPQTTVDDVKKSFNVNSSLVHVYNKEGNQEISQGYIGTGMQIKFDNHETTYIASVIGDLTGNGKIQQIEVSRAIKHVIGLKNYQLTGVSAISVDVNADGIIDQKDVSILIKYVVFGRLNIGELTRPTAPIIEIVNGTEGKNGWFTSDVVLKIKKPQSTPIPISGLLYEITGTISKELTSIQGEETLEFTEEGIYEVKCYSITAMGVKSLVNTKTIKIDKTDPIAGTINSYINNIGGQTYINNAWTNQNVCVQLINGTDGLSGHAKTVYKVTGATRTEELTENTTIVNEGTYYITVVTEDLSGRTAERTYQINIDKTKPEAPSIKVKTGEKSQQDNEWYISEVTLEVIQGAMDTGKSGISYTTYEISGVETVTETRIDDHGTIELLQDGIHEITVYNYDLAGNKSEGTKVIIKEDKTAVQDIQIEASQITGTSMHLNVSATDETSGIVLYQIYVDEQLYREIESNNTMVELDIINLSSKVHNITVNVKDLAGNVGSASSQINVGRLSAEDIDHVEFVVDNFTKTRNNQGVASGASYIISDTSISEASKYIQVSSAEAQVQGNITGRIRVVRKNGEIVNEFEYYPENLEFKISQYSHGSGSTWQHQASVNVANTVLSNTGVSEGTTTTGNIYIRQKQNSDNIFSVTDKKVSGTETYTRLIINDVILNGEKVMFKIVSNII